MVAKRPALLLLGLLDQQFHVRQPAELLACGLANDRFLNESKLVGYPSRIKRLSTW